jgi:hypothetical protein
MNWRAKRRIIFSVLLFFVLPISSMGANGKSVRENLSATLWNRDLGIILNTHSLLFDIDSYKGGIGAKLSSGSFVLRGAADLRFDTGFNPFSVTLDVGMEKHFLPGPISPYWGIFVDVGFTQLTEADGTRYITFPLTVGPLLGIEIFIFDFLSVFVEFSLPLTLGIETTQTSVAGSVTSSSKFIYGLDLGLSNQSMLGIVIYLTRKRFR